MFFAHLAASGTMVYDWIWIVVGLVTVLGAILAGIRYVGMKAVRNSKLDTLLAAVTSNGGESTSVGDTMLRTEKKIDMMIGAVAEQKGHTDAVEKVVFTRLDGLETRVQVI